MSEALPDTVRRQQAVAATLARFRGRPMEFRSGHTCVHLARFHLRAMGHRPPPIPRFSSEIGARRALAERGWGNCADLLDSLPGLCRVAPLAMLPGDLAVIGSEDGIGAIVVALARHKFAGWRADGLDALRVYDVDLSELSAAWRL